MAAPREVQEAVLATSNRSGLPGGGIVDRYDRTISPSLPPGPTVGILFWLAIFDYNLSLLGAAL